MNRDELEDGIYALLDGELNQEQLDQLEAAILADPDGLTIYRECSRLHTALKVSMGARKSLENWNVVPIERINAMERKRWFRYSVAAAMVALMCVATVLWWKISENRPLRHSYGASIGAVYSVIHPPGHENDKPDTLVEGSRLVLESGTIECWLQQGVRAVLTSPCDLTVTKDNGITLSEGTGFFHVAKGAEGFTVTTPELVAEDLGTEFGVLSAPDQNDEVHVFSGKVRVTSRAPLRQTTELIAGKSIYTDAAGRLKPDTEYRKNLFTSLSNEKNKAQPTNMKHKIAAASVLAAASMAQGAVTLVPSSLARVRNDNTVSTITTDQLLASDSSTAGAVFVSTFNFNLSSNTADIAAASQITFSISADAKLGTGGNIRLVAFTTDDNTVTGSDFTAPGTIVSTFNNASIVLNTPLVFDVTSFVKADALAGSFTSYRLERDIDTNTGSTADGYRFKTLATNDAKLTIVPEPSTALLGSLTFLGLLLRRRR